MPVEPVPHRFTADEFEQMGAAGLFPTSARLELLDREVWLVDLAGGVLEVHTPTAPPRLVTSGRAAVVVAGGGGRR